MASKYFQRGLKGGYLKEASKYLQGAYGGVPSGHLKGGLKYLKVTLRVGLRWGLRSP